MSSFEIKRLWPDFQGFCEHPKFHSIRLQGTKSRALPGSSSNHLQIKFNQHKSINSQVLFGGCPKIYKQYLMLGFWKCSQYLWKSFGSSANTCGNLLKVQPILVEIFWKCSQLNTCWNLLKVQPIIVEILTSWHLDTTGGRLSWAWWNCGTLQPWRVRWAELRACCSLLQYIFWWEIGALWVT